MREYQSSFNSQERLNKRISQTLFHLFLSSKRYTQTNKHTHTQSLQQSLTFYAQTHRDQGGCCRFSQLWGLVLSWVFKAVVLIADSDKKCCGIVWCSDLWLTGLVKLYFMSSQRHYGLTSSTAFTSLLSQRTKGRTNADKLWRLGGMESTILWAGMVKECMWNEWNNPIF